MEKRKQAAEEARANRQKALENSTSQDAEDTSALDNLLEQLRSGSAVGRRARRARPSTSTQSGSLSVVTDVTGDSSTGNDPGDLARDMLARLKSDGFNALMPASPTSATAPRRSRRREEFKGIAEELEQSPMLKLGDSLQFGDEEESDGHSSETQGETASEVKKIDEDVPVVVTEEIR